VKLLLNQFGGMMPRVSPRLLPPTAASFASNAKLTNGALRGFRSPLRVATVTLPPGLGAAARAFPIYRPDGSLYFFPRGDPLASLVRSPVTGDQFHRYYWTEPGQSPRYAPLSQMENGVFFTLGVQRPTAAPVVTPSGGGGAGAVQTIRAYAYTYVTQFGEEGPPSPAAIATGWSDDTWHASGWTDVSQPDRPVTKVNVYRTVPGQQVTDFFFVVQLPVATSSYADTQTDVAVALNAILPSVGWDEPPPDLQGLVAHASGFLAGFVGRDVYLSVPYRPHAWPASNILTLQEEIVALSPLGDAIVALTKAYPIILSGSTPTAVTPISLNDIQPCLSPRSVVQSGANVVYASPNGLVAVSTSGVELLTNDLVTREEWMTDYSPREVGAARYGPYYISVTSQTQGWAFAGQYEPATLTRLDRLQNIDGLEPDPRTGAVYTLIGGTVYEFDAVDDRRLAVTWVSKEHVSEKPVNFGAFRVDFEPATPETEQDHDDIVAATQAWNVDRFAFPSDLVGGTVLGGLEEPVPLRLVDGDGLSFLPPVQPVGGPPLFEVTELFGENIVRVGIVADGRQVFFGVVEDGVVRRLPSGFKARLWQVSLESNRTVYQVAVAETGKELGSA
jgi:hypothetical protein